MGESLLTLHADFATVTEDTTRRRTLETHDVARSGLSYPPEGAVSKDRWQNGQ
jgi:hypothetical protein